MTYQVNPGLPGFSFSTERIQVRPLTNRDAPFVLEILNDPDFIRFIADRHVRTLPQAVGYVKLGPRSSYRTFGYGLCLVVDLDTGAPAGMCGLLKRYYLDAPDLGYAFLPAFRGRGLALEAATATIDWACRNLTTPHLNALVHPENARSILLLEKLGFVYAEPFEIPGEKPLVQRMQLNLNR